MRKKLTPQQRHRKGKRHLLVGFIYISVCAFVGILIWSQYSANVKLATEARVEFKEFFDSLPTVPEEKNGALLVLEGIGLLEEFPDQSLLYEYCVERQTDEKVLRDYLARNEGALRLIERGLEFKQWLYPVEYYGVFGTEYPILPKFRYEATESLLVKGDFAKLADKQVKALGEYGKVLRLGNTLSSCRASLPRLVEMALYSLGLERIMKLLSDSSLSKQELQSFLTTLVTLHSGRGSLFSAIEGDYYSYLKCLADGVLGCESTDECEGEKTGRASQDDDGSKWFSMFRCFLSFQRDVEVRRRCLELFRDVAPGNYHSLENHLKDSDLLAERVNLSRDEAMSMGRWSYAMSAVGVLRNCAICETFWRAAIAMAAVRLFEAKNQRLPEKLEELSEFLPKSLLVDPFSGKHLVYERKGNDFSLYSVGLDGVDNKCEASREPFTARANEGEPDDIIFHSAQPQ